LNTPVTRHVPKKPTGAIAPGAFSYDLRAMEALPLEAGAKAAALARREAVRANFMISRNDRRLQQDCEFLSLIA
jgi:hypothetical protein